MSPSTPLALKVTTIVYNPPFQKFLDPPLSRQIISQLVGRIGELSQALDAEQSSFKAFELLEGEK